MPKVKYTGAGQIAIGSSPEDIRKYGGAADAQGKVEEVPADVAKLLIASGLAEPVKGR